MPSQRARYERVLGDLNPAWFDDRLSEPGLFRGCTTGHELRATLREQVELEVDAMANLIADADAFDVIELMRLRELSPVSDPTVVNTDGSALSIEIVAAVLLSRPSRKPDPRPRSETRPHEVVEDLHKRSQRLARLATYRQLFEARLSDDRLADLAADYQGAVLNIRNIQYDQIRNDQESLLFDNPIVRQLMQQFLRYTYGDLVAVRAALADLSAGRMTGLRDGIADIISMYPGIPPSQVPPEAVDKFVDQIVPLLFLPADRATISISDVAEAAGLDAITSAAVLESYAQSFDETQPTGDRVFEMLVKDNQFLLKPLVSDGKGNFVATSTDVGLDSLRRIFETRLPGNFPEFDRYDKKVRQTVSEQLAMRHLETIFQSPPSYSNFTYFMPKQPEHLRFLGADCVNVNEVAKQTEGDGLFVIDDVAICVEVKGKSMAAQARRGDVRRLSTDLKKTVGDASDQASRVQELIKTHHGLWLGDHTWLDLGNIREVRSVVALLDDIGPLGTALGDLQTAGIVANRRPPWIASLHDLAVIAEICDRPGEFLLYVRRRTDSDVTTYYRATDELDLYMLFLEGNLYVEPNPDEVILQHPTAPPAKNRDRKRHKSGAMATMVTDHCHDLNVWMQRADVAEHGDLPTKPSFNTSPDIFRLIDPPAASRAPGWLRFSADLLGLAGESQQRITSAIKECVRRTREDHGYHHAVFSYAGLWGHPTLFLGSHSRDISSDAARSRLLTYMRAKRHQLGSDRAYGLLLDQHRVVEEVIYLNGPLDEGPEIGALVQSMRLRPAGDRGRPVPPRARRNTKRLRGTHKKR